MASRSFRSNLCVMMRKCVAGLRVKVLSRKSLLFLAWFLGAVPSFSYNAPWFTILFPHLLPSTERSMCFYLQNLKTLLSRWFICMPRILLLSWRFISHWWNPSRGCAERAYNRWEDNNNSETGGLLRCFSSFILNQFPWLLLTLFCSLFANPNTGIDTWRFWWFDKFCAPLFHLSSSSWN